jgi:hypothetical protein
MNSKEAKRIEALAASLRPDEIFSKWLNIFELSETFEQHLRHLPAESAGRQLAALMPNLKSPGEKGTNSKTRGLTKPDLPYMSLWYFVSRLIVGLNSSAYDLVWRAQYRLESAEVILQIESPLRALNPTARRKDATARVKIAALLARARENITSNLRELQSLKLACEGISGTYGRGHKLLHQTLTVKIEELHKSTLGCAHDYERARKELLAGPVSSGTKWPPELREIDFDGIEKLAVSEKSEIVRMLEVSAKAQMRIAFDETPKAFEILEPFLQGGGDPEEE